MAWTKPEMSLAIFFFLLFSISGFVYVYEQVQFQNSLPDRDSQRFAYDSLCPSVFERPLVSYDFFWLVHEGLVNASFEQRLLLDDCVKIV